MTSTPSPEAQGHGHGTFLDPAQHVIWSTSGGGMRSFAANIGYASSFAALGLITGNSTKFSGISSTSGGSWFTLQLFFSHPFFDAIVSSTPDEVATLVSNLTFAFASVQPDSPPSVSQFCQDIQKYVSFSSIFDDILSICSFTADWEKLVVAFLDNAAVGYGDDKLAERLASGENIISPLSDAWLQIQMSIGASARSSDLLDVSYFGPVGALQLQTTPVPLSWGTEVETTRGGAWFPAGVTNQSASIVQSSKTFNTHDYSYSNLFPAANDVPFHSPNLLGVETVGGLKMPVPFGGKPTVSQLAAASSAVAAATSGGIPSSFAQTISFVNTTRECSPILSSSFLDSASAKALDHVANQIWSTSALNDLSVCSDHSDSGDCPTPFSRLMDGGYSDNIALATNIARYQNVYGAQGPSSSCLRAIITNNNMYTLDNFDMLSFFNTSFNQGIEPGGFLWPTSWAMNKNNTIPNPRRSPQIFAECMSDADLDDAMVSIPGTNLTTALLHGTTIKNDAFGVEAGLCVSILLLQTNSNITTLVLPPNALAYQDSLADLAKTIASNDMIKERVAVFLGSDVPVTNFSCSFAEEKNIPACEPKRELPLSELFQEIAANDNWCTADNTVSSSKCDQYLQSISSFITPIPAVPNWLFALSIAVACLFPLLYLALAFRKGKKQKWEESGDVDVSLASAATAKEIKLVGLNVVSDEAAKILENVSLHLKPGTMNGLLGLSGSGKSTLLGVLSQSLRPNLRMSMSNHSSNIAELNYAYLRQSDSVDMDSMTPVEYLCATARVLGTPDDRLRFVLESTRSVFPLKKEIDKDGHEKITLDPFNSTRIVELSGGQRRIVAIATKLFDEPSILLLDEPLSGLDSASSIELINMLQSFIEKTGLIVLIILHQPSNEILEAMDSISVMIKGQIVFHQEDMLNFNPEVGPAKYVHQILRNGSSGVTDLTPDVGMEGESIGIRSSCIPSRFSIVQPSVVVKSTRRIGLRDNIDIEQQEGRVTSNNVSEYLDRVHYHHTQRLRQTSLESSPRTLPLHATTTRGLKDLVSNATSFIRQVPQAIAKDFILLWQVQPLLRRMQLSVGTPWLDFGVVPTVAVVAGWSQYNSKIYGVNDVIQLSVFAVACVVPFGNLKLYEHFDIVKAHAYDLKDNKISALAFLIASSIRLISLSVPAAFAAYAVAFATNGWNFGLYLDTTLFGVFYMLNLLQLGKIVSLCFNEEKTFSVAVQSYTASSIAFSGIFALPVEVHPDGMRIFMYLSLQYWSFAGTLVNWFSSSPHALGDTSDVYYEIENPIAAATEIVPSLAQYEWLSNPKKSLLVLFFVLPFLSMIEYIILLGMTLKKPNRCESRQDDTKQKDK